MEATDSSAEQIAQAPALPGVRFRVAPAEASGLADQSVDLISVAQAFHWFNREAFYAEVRRVARPCALLALYGYSWFYVSPEIDELTNRWLLEPVESYWNSNNRLLWDGYRTVDFPFEELAAPRLALHLSWTLDQLFDYYLTWSAPRRRIAADGDAFVAAARRAFETVWQDPKRPAHVVMPMCARLGRVQRAATFQHVKLSGYVGKMKINQWAHFVDRTAATQAPFTAHREELYSSIDWALDISDGIFLEFDHEGIPARLIRRDPETQRWSRGLAPSVRHGKSILTPETILGRFISDFFLTGRRISCLSRLLLPQKRKGTF